MNKENLNKKDQLDAEIAFLAQREVEEREEMTRKYLTGEGGEEEAAQAHKAISEIWDARFKRK